MGFFSWKTADTDESIPAEGNRERKIFTVYVLCPDGTKIREDRYQGYGEFGGKDVYELFAQWNCPEKCIGDTKTDRILGIYLPSKHPEKIKYPIKIVRDPNLEYEQVGPSPACEFQGWFYEDTAMIEDKIISAIESSVFDDLWDRIKHEVKYEIEEYDSNLTEEKVDDCISTFVSKIEGSIYR